MLLQKTLFNIEGLGRQLYPDLDLWKTAHPVLRQWMDEQIGGRAMLASIRENMPQLREALRELPGVIRQLSEQAGDGSLRMRMDSPELKAIKVQLKTQQTQHFWLGIGATSVLSGTLILALASPPWIGWTLVAAGLVALFKARPGGQ